VSEAPPPRPALVEADLRWDGGTQLNCRSGAVEASLDWESREAASPVQALVFALAGCMASDVVLILQKGRQPLRGLAVRVRAVRAAADPRRLVEVDLRFRVTGAVPAARVERAIALSRETYCSVWHSLARDIVLATSFEIEAAPAA
jgi:putative redox protein